MGEHDRRGFDRRRPTTPTSGRFPTSRTRRRRRATRCWARRRSRCSACRSSTGRARSATGTTTRTPRRPGIFGPSHLPSLFRDDYVTNSNDSYWLSNPAQPLEGFSRIIGDERTARTLRTRLGLKMAAGRRFSLKDLTDTVFNDRQYGGELLAGELAAYCRANPTLTGSSGPVDVSAACPVLEKLGEDRHARRPGRAAVPALGDPRSGLGGRRGLQPDGLQRALRPGRPGEHPARAEHGQPAGRPGAGRRRQGAARLRDPARRDAARGTRR